MKVVSATGLAPAKFLKSVGSYAEGEIHGLPPAEYRRLRARGIIDAAGTSKDIEYTDVDDETLLGVPVPSLGGFDHQPPLASRALPGRNLIDEPGDEQTGPLPAGGRPAAYEDDEVGRGNPNPMSPDGGKTLKSEDVAATTRSTSGGPAPTSSPPAPPASAKTK